MSSRIEDYGLIGDCETAALVGRDGSIDWLCWPAFDSDACFAALLGTHKHGRWKIAPSGDVVKCSRRYRNDTLILETRLETIDGTVTLIDFMPPRGKASDVVRLIRGESGCVKLRMELIIRFGFGRDIPWVKRTGDGALLAICGPDMTVLRTPIETRGEDMTTVADFEVSAGETIPFVLTYGPSHLAVPEPIDPEQALRDTEDFWSDWSGRCTYRWRPSRPCDAVADHPEGADLRADRRHRRSAHHLIAGKARRRPQLGLPVLLAARRHIHAAGADEQRLHRGGAGVAQLAAARRRGIAGRHADHVRHLPASGACWNGRPAGCPAMAARSRCGSAMPRMRNCNSTSTAN